MFVVRPSVRAINSGSSTITISTLQLDEIKRSQRMFGAPVGDGDGAGAGVGALLATQDNVASEQ